MSNEIRHNPAETMVAPASVGSSPSVTDFLLTGTFLSSHATSFLLHATSFLLVGAGTLPQGFLFTAPIRIRSFVARRSAQYAWAFSNVVPKFIQKAYSQITSPTRFPISCAFSARTG